MKSESDHRPLRDALLPLREGDVLARGPRDVAEPSCCRRRSGDGHHQHNGEEETGRERAGGHDSSEGEKAWKGREVGSERESERVRETERESERCNRGYDERDRARERV